MAVPLTLHTATTSWDLSGALDLKYGRQCWILKLKVVYVFIVPFVRGNVRKQSPKYLVARHFDGPCGLYWDLMTLMGCFVFTSKCLLNNLERRRIERSWRNNWRVLRKTRCRATFSTLLESLIGAHSYVKRQCIIWRCGDSMISEISCGRRQTYATVLRTKR